MPSHIVRDIHNPVSVDNGKSNRIDREFVLNPGVCEACGHRRTSVEHKRKNRPNNPKGCSKILQRRRSEQNKD
jgi:hypothetical protein